MSPSLIILCLTIPVKLMRFNYILKEICNTYLRKHWPFLSSPDCKVYGKWKSAAGLLADCHKIQRGCSEMCEIYAHHPRTEIKQEKKKRMKNDFQREKQPGAKKNPLGFKLVILFRWRSTGASLLLPAFLQIFSLLLGTSVSYDECLYVSQPSQFIAKLCIYFLLQKASIILTLQQVLALLLFSGSICKCNTTFLFLSTKE